MKNKLTPWFPTTIKPVHRGWYQTNFLGYAYTGYSYWHGSYWSNERAALPTKYDPPVTDRGNQNKTWRGVLRADVPSVR